VAHRTRAALALALSLAGCSSRKASDPPEGLGRRVHDGAVRALAPSPDGATLAFLDGCEDVRNARFLPPGTARCDLRVVPATGGGEARIAAGVTTLPQGLSWRPDGKALVAMADYDHAAAAATLVVWEGGTARKLADGVTFHGYGKNGELGFVAGGRLSLLLPGDPAPRVLPGGDAIASFDLTPFEHAACDERVRISTRLVARRAQAAGGELLRAGCALDRLEPLERGQVGDYGFSAPGQALAYTVIGKDGTALRYLPVVEDVPPTAAARSIQSFAFGPGGVYLAYSADAAPGRQGNLHYGQRTSGGWRDVELAKEVGEFRWAAKAPRLAWLERYDPRVRAGTVGVGGEHLPARTLARNVSDIDLTWDGQHVAFLQHTTRGGYSVDLGLAQVDPAGVATPATVATGVFGFSFSPDGRWLYYRTRCVRNAEACDLERVPASGLAPGAAPERIAEGVKSFEFDPRDPARLLLGWQRADLVALDLGVWEQGRLTRVDSAVLPGSAQFLGPDSRRLAYVVAAPRRQGVYVAELPK
jgi:dipeptidyl aminopeptidase/acylaminoacyl peptidase